MSLKTKTRKNIRLLLRIQEQAEDFDTHIDELLARNRDIPHLKFWMGAYRKATIFQNTELADSAMQKVKQLLKV